MLKKSIRIDILIFCFLVLFGFLIFRLFTIQVLNHSKYRVLANEQHLGIQEIPSKRGDILSSDGFTLATTQVSFLMYGEPDKITDPLQAATDIALILFDEDTFEDKRDKYYELLSLDLRWVGLEHYLTSVQRAKIDSLNIIGLGFEEEPRRYYPEQNLASHALGFVAHNDLGEEQGYFGIEGEFDGDLKGKSGRVVEEKDAFGNTILVGAHTLVDSIDGRDVVLTLNRAVQYIVENHLEDGVRSYGAKSGSVVVMDPLTGDVLAMANFPTYDPTDFSDFLESEENDFDESIKDEISYETQRRNIAISGTYEPGSVIKALTISAGIDLGKIKPSTTFEDNGPVSYSGFTIDNWDEKHHGTQTITQLLQKSNNIGSAWVGHKIGAKNLSSYFADFGLGEVTGIELEGEDTGIIRNYKEWADIDLATAAFGQGISATPLQVLNVFNVIANGGELFRPRIVSTILEDEVIEIPVKKIRRVISEKSSRTMIKMLTEAVSGGESKYYNIKNYNIAGKTGTAQISVDGKYDPKKTNATFVGFLPTSKKFSMIVKLEEPTSSVYASETAVPLWMEITADLVNFYGIAPDNF